MSKKKKKEVPWGKKLWLSDFTINLMIGIAAAAMAAIVTTVINLSYENRELKRVKQMITTLQIEVTQQKLENRKLKDSIKEYMDEKTRNIPRLISYQLERISLHLDETQKDVGRKHTLEILGMNALGPIHQGKRILTDLLMKGGEIRVLLLDPLSMAFNERLAQEKDIIRYNAAELMASLYGLAEVASRVGESNAKRIKVRFYAKAPDRSLIIVDRNFPDGFILGNRYPPKEEKGKEGYEGDSYQEPMNTVRVVDDLKHFDELWKSAGAISLPNKPFNISGWPFGGYPSEESKGDISNGSGH